jgi:hypothetical protein
LAEDIGENGTTYHLGEGGWYYLRITLAWETDYPIGKYGIMRAEYLWENCRREYFRMVREGTWNRHLHEVDEECHREVELAVKRMMEKEGVTGQLKAENPMEWVRRVNAVKSAAEEMVLKEFVYV